MAQIQAETYLTINNMNNSQRQHSIPYEIVADPRFKSPNWVKEWKEREKAAINMCGGLLGNCYLLAEIAENLMVDAIARFKKEGWYKFELKQCFQKARTELHSIIARSIMNSPTNADYMREVADATYDLIKLDLFKLKNSILIEVGKGNVKYPDTCADIAIIDIILRLIGIEYDDALEYMSTVFDAYYDSWYHNAKCEGPAFWWNKGLQLFGNKYVAGKVDLNHSVAIQNGVTIIQKRMHSADIAEAASDEASKYADEGNGREMYEKALSILGK